MDTAAFAHGSLQQIIFGGGIEAACCQTVALPRHGRQPFGADLDCGHASHWVGDAAERRGRQVRHGATEGAEP